jgi:TrmH family RNA methyltransferase
MQMIIESISSRDNPQSKLFRRLAQSNSSYKENGLVWLEGEHLCASFISSTTNVSLSSVAVSNSQSAIWLPQLQKFDASSHAGEAFKVFILPDQLMAAISALPSSAGIAFVLRFDHVETLIKSSNKSLSPTTRLIDPDAHSIILDGVQDSGNVGSILRSAAAFGVTQVLALSGSASLWSPKVLRAGMGAHFSLRLIEDLEPVDIALQVPLLATHVHAGQYLHDLQSKAEIPNPCAWIMGHEGQGISKAMLARAEKIIRIRQCGQESLNVAVAAAVCLYAGMAK